VKQSPIGVHFIILKTHRHCAGQSVNKIIEAIVNEMLGWWPDDWQVSRVGPEFRERFIPAEFEVD
jgi:hypothetical protein